MRRFACLRHLARACLVACGSVRAGRAPRVEWLQAFARGALGDFELELDNRTPLHSVNFIRLVKMGYFKERYFYRNVYEIGIQGGGEYFDRLNYLVPAEYREELRPVRGSLAMARYDEGNPQKASSPTEFFIITNTEQAARFYKQYVVFGKITKGLSVIDSIQKQRSFDEKPVIPVKFTLSLLKD